MRKKISIKFLYLIISFFLFLFLNIILLVKNTELSIFLEIIVHYIITDLSLFLILIRNNFNFVQPSSIFAILYILLICYSPVVLLLSGYKMNFSIIFIIAIPLFLFSLGTFFSPNKKIRISNNEIEPQKRVYVNKINTESFLYLLIFFSFFIWIIYIKGNISSILTGNFENSRITSQSGNGMYLYLIRMWIITIPLLFEYYLKKEKIPYKFYLVFLMVMIALLFLGGRTPIILIIINCLICKIVINEIDSSKMLLYGIMCLFIVGLIGFFRMILSGNVYELLHSFQSIFNNGIYNLNYIFDKFPSKISFQKGYTYLINLKMLLPGPDQDFTLWLKEALGMNFVGGGVTPTIIGEFYINFGIVGIWIGMFSLGFIFKRFDILYKSYKCKSYITFIILQLCLSVSGGLANYIVPILLYSLVYLTINIFTSQKFLEKNLSITTARSDKI